MATLTRFENFVIEQKLKDQLSTQLNLRNDVTVDPSLVGEPGRVIKVNVYKMAGQADKVTEGSGNTNSVTMSVDSVDHTIATYQAKFSYSDEAAMADPFLVDGGVKNTAVAVSNAITADIVAEWQKTTKTDTWAATTMYADIIDGIAMLNMEDNASGADNEGGDPAFIRVNPAMKAELRKALKDELKYNTDSVQTGYIGSIAGVPVLASKAIPDNKIIIACKSAVKFAYKVDGQTEQDRVADTRTNIIYARTCGVVALVDETKCVVLSKAQ